MKRKHTWLSNKEFTGSYGELAGVILVSGKVTYFSLGNEIVRHYYKDNQIRGLNLGICN